MAPTEVAGGVSAPAQTLAPEPEESFAGKLQWLADHTTGEMLRGGAFGIEREGLRVTPSGELAQTPHPLEFGDKLTNPEITVDFSESQLELVTRPQPTLEHAWDALRALHQRVAPVLAARGESLWPHSMPPAVADELLIPIARFPDTADGRLRELYRTGLATRYGRRRQLISGVHANVSFSRKLLDALHRAIGAHVADTRSLDDAAYFRTLRNFQRQRWLLVYLTGASPVPDPSRPTGHPSGPGEATSLRVSRHGYANTNTRTNAMRVSFNTLEAYIRDLRKLLKTPSPDFAAAGLTHDGRPIQLNDRVLQLEKEFYAPIRPKGRLMRGDTHLDAMERRGVAYLEVRLLDLNPFIREGVDLTTLRMVHVFLLDCLLGADASIDAEEWRRLEDNHERVARFGRRPDLRLRASDGDAPLIALASPILRRLDALAALMDRGLPGEPYSTAVAHARELLRAPDLLPSARIAATLSLTPTESLATHAH